MKLKEKLIGLSDVYPDWGLWADAPFNENSDCRVGRMAFKNGGLLDEKVFFGRLDILTDRMDAQVDPEAGDIEYQREVAAETLIEEIETERHA